ncbi:hypothetical protein NBRC116188_17960 [Oceaniserpentilla sp. 4NH20-0058]
MVNLDKVLASREIQVQGIAVDEDLHSWIQICEAFLQTVHLSSLK